MPPRSERVGKKKGLHVPPILVFSVTSKCNLHCKGCYHQTLRQKPNSDISDERLKKAIAEAKELGISFIVFGGGEPLMRPSLLDIPNEYPEIMFLMFTNGLLINDAVLKKMNEKKNVIPLLSLEGYQTDTDERRGKGVYEMLQKSIAKLKENGMFWGTSLTLTRRNFDEVTDEISLRNSLTLAADCSCSLSTHPSKKAPKTGSSPKRKDSNWSEEETRSARNIRQCSSHCPGTKKRLAAASQREEASST